MTSLVLNLPYDTVYLDLVYRALEVYARELKFDDKKTHELNLVVSEVVTNAMLYGKNEELPNALVFMSMQMLDGQNVQVVVQDHGRGFDCQKVEQKIELESDVLGSLNDGGRGMFLMKKFCDQLDYQQGQGEYGTKVLITKNMGRREDGNQPA